MFLPVILVQEREKKEANDTPPPPTKNIQSTRENSKCIFDLVLL